MGLIFLRVSRPLGWASLSCLVLFGLCAGWAHPGPPVFLRLRVEADGLSLRLSGEQDVLLLWFGVEGSFDESSAPSELEAIAEGARQRLTRDWLAVDGRAVDFESIEVEAQGPEGDLSRTYGEPTLAIELRAGLEGLPQRVDLVWGDFEGAVSEQDQRTYVPAVIRGDGSFKNVELTPLEPQFTWRPSSILAPGNSGPMDLQEDLDPRLLGRRTWRAPMLTLGLLAVAAVGLGFTGARGRASRGFLGLALASPLAWGRMGVEVPIPFLGAREPGAAEALEVFDLLHRGVYRAFGSEGEDEIYAALQPWVQRELLDELYVQIYGELVLEEQGGARSVVDRIEVLDERVLPAEGAGGESPSFAVERIWRAHGSVRHWGHRHDRVVRIRGRYTVAHDGVSWKLAGQEVLDHERLTTEDAESVLPESEPRDR